MFAEEEERDEAGEDDLDAKAVQAGENLDQFLASGAKEAAAPSERLTSADGENKELRLLAQRLGRELSQAKSALDVARKECDEFRRQLEVAQQQQQQQPRPLPLSAAASIGAVSSFQGSPVHQRFNSSRVSSPVIVEDGPVCKVAERVRIRRLEGRDRVLTGSQIASLGVSIFLCMVKRELYLCDMVMFAPQKFREKLMHRKRIG